MPQKKIQKSIKSGKSSIDFGHTSFSKKLADDYPNLAKEKVLRKFQELYWQIPLGSQQMKVLPYIQKTQCQALSILIDESKKQIPTETITLLKTLIHIDFSNLKFLELFSFNIRSFQGLAFLNLDSLEKLTIGQDYITGLKSLNKKSLPNVKQIILDCLLPVMRVDLARVKTNKSLKKFKMGCEQIIAPIEDLSRLMKMDSKEIRVLTLVYDFQQKIWDKFKERFSTRLIIKGKALNHFFEDQNDAE